MEHTNAEQTQQCEVVEEPTVLGKIVNSMFARFLSHPIESPDFYTSQNSQRRDAQSKLDLSVHTMD